MNVQPHPRWLNWALKQHTGNPMSNLILIHMAARGNRSGMFWGSVGNLAKAAGVSERTVQRAIRRLQAQELVISRSDLHETLSTNTYQFVENSELGPSL